MEEEVNHSKRELINSLRNEYVIESYEKRWSNVIGQTRTYSILKKDIQI